MLLFGPDLHPREMAKYDNGTGKEANSFLQDRKTPECSLKGLWGDIESVAHQMRYAFFVMVKQTVTKQYKTFYFSLNPTKLSLFFFSVQLSLKCGWKSKSEHTDYINEKQKGQKQ